MRRSGVWHIRSLQITEARAARLAFLQPYDIDFALAVLLMVIFWSLGQSPLASRTWPGIQLATILGQACRYARIHALLARERIGVLHLCGTRVRPESVVPAHGPFDLHAW